MKQKLMLLAAFLLLALSAWLATGANSSKSTGSGKQACKSKCDNPKEKRGNTGFLLFDAFSGAL